MNWKEASKLMMTARNMEKGKPLKNNTRLYQDGDDFYIVLHSTRIITIHRDGTYTLNTRGSHSGLYGVWSNKAWRTVTTKQRLNQYAPVNIYQRDFTWYLNDDERFYDDMRVNDVGMVVE